MNKNFLTILTGVLLAAPAARAMTLSRPASTTGGSRVNGVAPLILPRGSAALGLSLTPATLKSPLAAALPAPRVQLQAQGLPALALPAIPQAAPAVAPVIEQAASEKGRGILSRTEAAFQDASYEKGGDPAQASAAAFDNNRAKPGAVGVSVIQAEVALPDTQRGWYDRFTGRYETEATKIKKALDLALSNPLARAIKDALPANTLYRVEKTRGIAYAARTQGDDPELTSDSEPLVVFTAQALRDLSPHYLAAKLAGLWVRHLYKDQIPQSAEKTYAEGSVFVRVFMALTGSTANRWNGDLDYLNRGNFEAYKHFYHWSQGFAFDNVRQGPYFKDKIMRSEGDPAVYTDERGRRTLYQRASDGEISNAAATRAQEKFDAFVNNERRN